MPLEVLRPVQDTGDHDNVFDNLIDDRVRPVGQDTKFVSFHQPGPCRSWVQPYPFKRVENAVIVAVRLRLTEIVEAAFVQGLEIQVCSSTEPKTHGDETPSPPAECPRDYAR